MATEGCGFVVIIAGTFLLHTTRDMDVTWSDVTRVTKDGGSTLTGSHLSNGSSGRERRGLLDGHSEDLAEKGGNSETLKDGGPGNGGPNNSIGGTQSLQPMTSSRRKQ